jgi:hypothetical protein
MARSSGATTTTQPVRSIKAQRPRIATSIFLDHVSRISWLTCVADHLSGHTASDIDFRFGSVS